MNIYTLLSDITRLFENGAAWTIRAVRYTSPLL